MDITAVKYRNIDMSIYAPLSEMGLIDSSADRAHDSALTCPKLSDFLQMLLLTRCTKLLPMLLPDVVYCTILK